MQAIDIANYLLAVHGSEIPLTNLRINKLVFFIQVESLRCTGEPIFDDVIEAWDCGPMIPSVYDSFVQYGTNQIGMPTGQAPENNHLLQQIASKVVQDYGHLTVFDLVILSHRAGGAWQKVYTPRTRMPISIDLLRMSADTQEQVIWNRTLASSLHDVNNSWAHTMRLLERS